VLQHLSHNFYNIGITATTPQPTPRQSRRGPEPLISPRSDGRPQGCGEGERQARFTQKMTN
jgi:hypothetical protein